MLEIGLKCTVNLRATTCYVRVPDGAAGEVVDTALFREVAAACRRQWGPGQLWWDHEFVPAAPPHAFTYVMADESVRLGMTAYVRCGVYHEIPATVQLTFEEYRRGGKTAWLAFQLAIDAECTRRLGPGLLRHVKDNEFRWELF